MFDRRSRAAASLAAKRLSLSARSAHPSRSGYPSRREAPIPREAAIPLGAKRLTLAKRLSLSARSAYTSGIRPVLLLSFALRTNLCVEKPV